MAVVAMITINYGIMTALSTIKDQMSLGHSEIIVVHVI
jgi:hypothetical protein